MAMAAGNAAYFQRGSLFWFAVITLSFGYYTDNGLERRPETGWGNPVSFKDGEAISDLSREILEPGRVSFPPRCHSDHPALLPPCTGWRRGTLVFPSALSVPGSRDPAPAHKLGNWRFELEFSGPGRRQALSTAWWVVLWPQSIPYESLGLLGSFTQYLVDHHHTLLHYGYWFAWLIHVAESLYAMVLCKYKGITNGRAQLLWFLQTFFFGIASLSILIAYRPKRQKQN
ncbi:transmembrane protein 254 isoform X1 [Lepus europaeus]|uniref:transmembrane protein 254 isoform X1 n=1 Tax=Lepus europaeus TaxID=9983 RepID=UPI002B45C538|nr:transmembrane protein 254 isoform X1 [Lepus europaeus]